MNPAQNKPLSVLPDLSPHEQGSAGHAISHCHDFAFARLVDEVDCDVFQIPFWPELYATGQHFRDWLMTRVGSKAELAVRAEANELKGFVVGFAIDEHEIRPNVAVTKVFPPAGERVIAKTRRRRLVGGQHGDHCAEQVVQLSVVSAGLRAPVIPLVSADSFNRPH